MRALPAGFRLVADPSLRRFGHGCVLVGGLPVRVLRLSRVGRAQSDELLSGEPVTDRTGALARRLTDAGLAHPRPQLDGSTPTATIVIPVRDRARQLERCLRALGNIAPVIVVDDGSKQPGTIAAACRSHGAKLLRLPQSRGPSAARNAALRMIGTDLVAFVDSDTAPEQGWLTALVAHFADPAVGAVAPRIRPLADGSSLLERYAAARSPLDMGAQEGLVIPYGRVPYIPTATMVIRRAALNDSGGFDEALRCAEDVDLVWRLHDDGWRVRYDPSIVVRHEEPSSWRTLLRRHRRYGQWSGPLGRRHPSRVAHLVIAPLPTASALLFLLRRYRPGVLPASIQALILARGLATGVPLLQSVSWAARWSGRTVVGLGRAATMFAAPLVACGVVVRRTRRTAGILLFAFPTAEFIARRPRIDPVCWLAICVADDFAYGIGVWHGCALARTTQPLRPLWITLQSSSSARSEHADPVRTAV